MTSSDFRIFHGTGEPANPPPELHDAPSWRRFGPAGLNLTNLPQETRQQPGEDWAPLTDPKIIDIVNAAIALRRPLLVSGPPGSGKSTLAAMIAVELGLGPVLHWQITSNSRLRQALYEYDAIGRLHDEKHDKHRDSENGNSLNVGRYIRLGPLGTALLPWSRPRVLLVDEFDKCDIDLPNELLHAFEIGSFTIAELARLPDKTSIEVMTEDLDGGAMVERGQVRCSAFPIVVLTSNQERVFPPAFLRRCLRATTRMPGPEDLEKIVRKRIQDARHVDDLIARFEQTGQSDNKTRAIDQLLHAVYLVSGAGLDLGNNQWLVDQLFEDLGEAAT